MAIFGHTTREIKQLSSPACSPQYTVTIPAGTCVRLFEAGRAVVEDIAKVQGGNAHDLKHYYVWIDLADVEIDTPAPALRNP